MAKFSMHALINKVYSIHKGKKEVIKKIVFYRDHCDNIIPLRILEIVWYEGTLLPCYVDWQSHVH